MPLPSGGRRGWKAALALVALGALGVVIGLYAPLSALAVFYQVSKPVPASVRLIAPLPGDVNLDFKVDEADLTIVARYFGVSPLPPEAPDLNGDGVINILDLVQVANNYRKEVPL